MVCRNIQQLLMLVTIKQQVFVFVIPKEGLVGWDPANSSLGMTPTREYNLQCSQKVSSHPETGKILLLLMQAKSFLQPCIMVRVLDWSEKVLDCINFGKIWTCFGVETYFL